jgi:hypothetical protein
MPSGLFYKSYSQLMSHCTLEYAGIEQEVITVSLLLSTTEE